MQAFEAAHEQARQPPPSFSGVDLRGAFKKLTEHDLSLQPGERGSDTEVRALAEGLEQIRSDPMRRLMLESTAAADLTDLHSSPILSRLAADLTGITDDDPQAAQWIVRVVTSLAYWPIGNSRAERQLPLSGGRSYVTTPGSALLLFPSLMVPLRVSDL